MSRMANTAVTVTATATQIVDGSPNRTLLVLTNNGVETVFLGAASVSTSAFIYPLESGDTVQWTSEDGDVAPEGKWFGVTASGSVSVSVGEISR